MAVTPTVAYMLGASPSSLIPLASESRRQVTEVYEPAKTDGAELDRHLALARWLLAHESVEPRDIEQTVDAAEVICGKLRGQLGKLIGPAGFDSLLVRAFHVSRRRFPFLVGFEPDLRDGRFLGGVRESVAGRDPEEVGEGFATLFASLLSSLGRFIGDDMALRQIARLWTELPIFDASTGPQETRE